MEFEIICNLRHLQSYLWNACKFQTVNCLVEREFHTIILALLNLSNKKVKSLHFHNTKIISNWLTWISIVKSVPSKTMTLHKRQFFWAFFGVGCGIPGNCWTFWIFWVVLPFFRPLKNRNILLTLSWTSALSQH